jgi:hypothetical protein
VLLFHLNMSVIACFSCESMGLYFSCKIELIKEFYSNLEVIGFVNKTRQNDSTPRFRFNTYVSNIQFKFKIKAPTVSFIISTVAPSSQSSSRKVDVGVPSPPI